MVEKKKKVIVRPNKSISNIGNTYAVKFPDIEERRKIYAAYCEHISNGFPKKSFYYKNGNKGCGSALIENYVKENSKEYNSSLIEEAEAKGFQRWFEEGIALVKGVHKGGSPVVWGTCMRNMFRKFGWDQDQTDGENRSHIRTIADALKNTSNPKP